MSGAAAHHAPSSSDIVPRVTVGIVTWNSAEFVEPCVGAVRAQTHRPIDLRIADNDSSDGTRSILERVTEPSERRYFGSNTGFSAAHNAIIRATRGDYYLALNPDVVLDPVFVARLVTALESSPRAGSASGKLMRGPTSDIIDSTGIIMLPSQRHLDRGADETDTGQYATPGQIFGPSGAAAFYRRAMLEDVTNAGEYFDEDFFAYREDADLAWRAQLLGWSSLYVPEARASHVRRVTPERRRGLPPEVNRYSVRNRFLLRIKNQPPGHALAFLVPALWRDLQVVGYVVLRERSSLGGLADVVRLLPRTLAKRRAIQRRRVMATRELNEWFRRGAFQARRPSALP